MKIKEKMVEFSTKKGETTVEFTTKLGVADSNFRGKYIEKGINSDVVIRFLEMYPDCSAEWLLRDKEPMIINTEQSFSFNNSGAGAMVNGVNNGTVQKNEGDCQECALLKAKDETIAAQKVTIEALSKR